ncbi:CAP domain-containing protein [Halalkalibacillus halophilus]|uniref:CAP domain-containing protein n=1 Tax=Halalkalibacillus halophilus TaxID=392827 RepID=UPI000420930B|nr:CAP domain-containing protein [Halalkalibacillus halophilus]
MGFIRFIILVSVIVLFVYAFPFNQFIGEEASYQEDDEWSIEQVYDDFKNRLNDIDVEAVQDRVSDGWHQIQWFVESLGNENLETPNVFEVPEHDAKEAADDFEAHEFEQEVLELVNEERAERGLGDLEFSNETAVVAREKSRDMSENDYFAHQSPTYGSPFDMLNQFGVQYRAAGENIAMGQRSPEQVMEGWMNSDGHRANILKEEFTHLGVGYVKDGMRTYWTQMFLGR